MDDKVTHYNLNTHDVSLLGSIGYGYHIHGTAEAQHRTRLHAQFCSKLATRLTTLSLD